ncbi:MAG: thioredoxin family protein [Pseudomonadota bacterium]
MYRRTFLAAACAVAIAPVGAYATETVDYTPGLIETALEEGKTVFVDYAADWCSTCRRQERVIGALRAGNPDYDKAMMFVRVDWDEYKNHDVTVFRDIPRRSTLIVLRGEEELGRLVAGTGEDQIKELMDKGLAKGS